jgi:hypothetical protein
MGWAGKGRARVRAGGRAALACRWRGGKTGRGPRRARRASDQRRRRSNAGGQTRRAGRSNKSQRASHRVRRLGLYEAADEVGLGGVGADGAGALEAGDDPRGNAVEAGLRGPGGGGGGREAQRWVCEVEKVQQGWKGQRSGRDPSAAPSAADRAASPRPPKPPAGPQPAAPTAPNNPPPACTPALLRSRATLAAPAPPRPHVHPTPIPPPPPASRAPDAPPNKAPRTCLHSCTTSKPRHSGSTRASRAIQGVHATSAREYWRPRK